MVDSYEFPISGSCFTCNFHFCYRQESEGKLEEAVATYSKSLLISPEMREGKEALFSLYERTNRLDLSKLAPVAALKANELKEKLRSILESDLRLSLSSTSLLGGKKDGKDKKKKKKGRKSSDSDDSSSSTSSSSDSDSSSSERDKKKKKKSKKKRKKAKKHKEKEKSKGKEHSLSPFSKRLGEGQLAQVPSAAAAGLAGFDAYAGVGWTQQLGFPPVEIKGLLVALAQLKRVT